MVWARIVSVRGVNAELMPIVRMTFPRGCDRLDQLPPVGSHHVFRSLLLLAGVLPIDVHTCTTLTLEQGRGFTELSHSLVHRAWRHRRSLQPVAGGTELIDQVDFACRLPFLTAALGPVVRWVFAHRHRRMRRHFGISLR
jgi:ligand-binding SRPBCC domain-containing protein